VPDVEGSAILALQFQLELSQWYRPGQLRALQNRQLDALLAHAHATVPYYRERWAGLHQPGEPATPGRFSRLPVFARSELQAHFDALKSTAVPPQHGAVTEVRTSGSTGQPVRLLKTSLTDFIWQAVLLREHHWFRRDLQAKAAAIRQGVSEGETSGWGPEQAVFQTGRVATLGIRADVATQLAWLERHQPAYLLTYPSNAEALARVSLERGTRLPKLREVRTFGELLGPETRAICREAWGAPVCDSYSAVESGYIALQCPAHEHYHVQSESVLLEILDDEGKACAPGEMGRVVVTTLHNFALPLIRYDIGDFAEVGPPCPCGRGLPVLQRIVGRQRNMLVTADGKRYWPALGTRKIAQVAPVIQYQLVQKDFRLIEARLVTARALTPAEEAGVRTVLAGGLPPGLEIKVTRCDSIPRSAGGKFEDFVSEVAAR
jgi:phenylacetate-CoA ligase